jgi:hypothetical protein
MRDSSFAPDVTLHSAATPHNAVTAVRVPGRI